MLRPTCFVTAVFLPSVFALTGLGPVGPPGGDGGLYKPGWNNEARTPPLGWRSWNAFGNHITQELMMSEIDAIVAKNWTVDGQKVSLFDVGYGSVGIDEGWEGCGDGVNGTQHYVNGTPAVNPKFPDMQSLVAYGHSKGLEMGFYQNGCACGERVEKIINYEGDIKYLNAMGFDAVKLDGCGKQRNLTLYAQLMKATGKSYAIENCHWGDCTQSDDSSCPTLEWCPFNWYRSSGDINNGEQSWMTNLQTTIRFQTPDFKDPTSVSRPSCWAYPDMLEVGRVQGSLEWNRAHFGAWCIVSAPLILGLDLYSPVLDTIIPIITNKEALAVNQAWEGHPGTLIAQFAPPAPSPAPGMLQYITVKPCVHGTVGQDAWMFDSSSGAIKYNNTCVDVSNPKAAKLAACTGSSAQKFSYDVSSGVMKNGNSCLDIWDWAGPQIDLYNCNGGTNQQFDVSNNIKDRAGTNTKCFTASATPPVTPSTANVVQLWAKPQPSSGMAVLIINNSGNSTSVTVDTARLLNMTGDSNIRSIWDRADTGVTQGGTFKVTVPSMDSAFVLLSPHSVAEL